MENTISLAEAQFGDRVVNGKYHVQMPKHLAEWGGWDNWEPERFASMEANLKKGDVLFDVGSEVGTISAIYAQFVGPENMCLFEPHPMLWPTIKGTWDAMGYATPRSARVTLVSDRNTMPETDFENGSVAGWPVPALTERIWTPVSYRHLDENANHTPQVSLDVLSAQTGIIPKAITIDVEGAELHVLRGAKELLVFSRPLVWLSVHPEFMAKRYSEVPSQVADFLEHVGYGFETLAEDHETHLRCFPKS